MGGVLVRGGGLHHALKSLLSSSRGQNIPWGRIFKELIKGCKFVLGLCRATAFGDM